ncbi:DNA-binding MurR/RpiR family transcriptional regulator [Pullulanibacillus pueri]|uniref:RpiR family transcriptional regulator n=1 Tax=Pullulanibacillus pueri TaxID=1437324 RepID=A0A8J3EM98_9BACL|nr:MurR/RpiR family transcriptional regulator [Pullulanibacillus pueri]MBM7682395.1 DNA-binding MurR/RpiR family transcriptional regulator [Pullulanibacillus pueri]GGH81805.1 RpiR family transcriptional regulator [Pullulanibacillus pueri]
MTTHYFLDLVQQHFHQLSKGQQKVGKLLVDNPHLFAINSASDIGLKANVSETTVIRFCYSIGLSGFSELQKKVREQLLSSNSSSLELYYSEKSKFAKRPDFYSKVMKEDCANIEKTIYHLKEDDLVKAVKKLGEAKKILVTGLRASYAAAHWLSFTLDVIRGDSYLYRPDTDDFVQKISQLNKETTVVAISFHRYIRETVHFAQLAKKQGAFVIGITDSPVAPISKYTDILLSVYQTEQSTLDATPSLFSLLNALIAGVSINYHERFQKRKEHYDFIDDSHLFI